MATRTLIAGLGLWLAACAEPPAPTYLPRSELGSPPLDKAQKCDPPYPSDFGNTMFAFADLDLGKSCTLYVEQDECVVAIYRDCAVTGATEREWQGRANNLDGSHRTVTLEPIIVGDGNQPARTPSCCAGEIEGEVGGFYTARLSCGIQRMCPVSDSVPEHVGMLLQEVEPDTHPEARIDPERSLIGSVDGDDVTALVTMPDREELYMVVDRAGVSPGDGLYRVEVATTGSTRLVPATSGAPLLTAVGPGALYFADGRSLVRVDSTGGVRATTTTVDEITALGLTRAGLLIATSSGLTNGTLRLLDQTTLGETASSPRPAPIVGLAGTTDPIAAGFAIAVAISMGSTDLQQIGPGPGLDVVNTVTPRMDEAVFPTKLHHLKEAAFGWLAPCHDSGGARMCYWLHNYGEATTRTSTPDVEGITGITISKDGNAIHLASSTGPISIADHSPVRLRLQDRVPFDEPTGPMATAQNGNIWVLLPRSNAIARLAPFTRRN